MKPQRAKTKVRKSSGSLASTIPKGMTETRGIEKGSTLVWVSNPDEDFMRVYLEEDED